MAKSNVFYVLMIILLLSCHRNQFVQKNRQLDLLPTTIPSDSIRFLYPTFTGSSVYGNEIEFSFNVQTQRQDYFKTEISNLLDSLNLKIDSIFLPNDQCLQNKIHPNNWFDEKWNSVESYKCLLFNPNLYTVFSYNIFITWEPKGVSSSPANERSHILSFIKVFFRNQIVYSKGYTHMKKLTNKEQKELTKMTRLSPFFQDAQIKYVVQKITEDLFKRIK